MTSKSQTPIRYHGLPTDRAEEKIAFEYVWDPVQHDQMSWESVISLVFGYKHGMGSAASDMPTRTVQGQQIPMIDADDSLLARSDLSYVAAPGNISSEPLHLGDVATLRRVDIIHIYLTWPQKSTSRRLTGGHCPRTQMSTALGPCLLQHGSRAPDEQLLGDRYP